MHTANPYLMNVVTWKILWGKNYTPGVGYLPPHCFFRAAVSDSLLRLRTPQQGCQVMADLHGPVCQISRPFSEVSRPLFGTFFKYILYLILTVTKCLEASAIEWYFAALCLLGGGGQCLTWCTWSGALDPCKTLIVKSNLAQLYGRTLYLANSMKFPQTKFFT